MRVTIKTVRKGDHLTVTNKKHIKYLIENNMFDEWYQFNGKIKYNLSKDLKTVHINYFEFISFGVSSKRVTRLFDIEVTIK